MKKFFLTTILAVFTLLNADCLGDNPGEVYFKAFTKDNNGNYTRPALYKTTDYGQTAQVVIPDFDAFIHKDKTTGGFYKIPVGSSQLYYSADTCKTWVLKNTTITNDGFQTGVFPGECWKYGYMSSNNNGSSWIEHAGNGVTSQVYNYALGLTQGEAYVYCIDQKLYRTTDYGENYSVVSSPNLGSAGVGRGWVPGELFIGTLDYKIYQSLDYGQTFNYLYNLPDFWGNNKSGGSVYGHNYGEIISYTIYSYPSMVYSQMEIKFYHSTDMGQSWDSVSTNYNVGIVENGEWRVENYIIIRIPLTTVL